MKVDLATVGDDSGITIHKASAGFYPRSNGSSQKVFKLTRVKSLLPFIMIILAPKWNTLGRSKVRAARPVEFRE
jgi:PII-like signaling protein